MIWMVLLVYVHACSSTVMQPVCLAKRLIAGLTQQFEAGSRCQHVPFPSTRVRTVAHKLKKQPTV